MLARRGASPGVTVVRGEAGVGRRWRNHALAVVRRKRLVFGPFLAQVLVALVARLFGEALVVLARLAALIGRELGPGLHAPLHALLLLRLHARIALGDADPLLAALGLERLPVGLERRQRLLLLGGQLRPRRTPARDGARRLGGRFRSGGRGGGVLCGGVGLGVGRPPRRGGARKRREEGAPQPLSPVWRFCPL